MHAVCVHSQGPHGSKGEPGDIGRPGKDGSNGKPGAPGPQVSIYTDPSDHQSIKLFHYCSTITKATLVWDQESVFLRHYS